MQSDAISMLVSFLAILFSTLLAHTFFFFYFWLMWDDNWGKEISSILNVSWRLGF